VNSGKHTGRGTSVLVGAAVAIGVLAFSGAATDATATAHSARAAESS
jgi:hypothetical protein